ncbi:thioredoxin family protein [Halalkalibacillus halophilus]|uniref:thioredoxin family protein n=1 Tax=Halalkalibacillus halophilus TaxID=392827 RepID=UPI00041CD844|nr:thioredoxin family protein [Halalkalibacillus halophilus]
MKKLLIFGSIIIVLFIAIALLSNMAQTDEVDGDNPYNKDSLHSDTADLLDDPNYQNNILPEELESEIENEEEVTVYFYSPSCEHCIEATPRLMPIAEDNDVELHQFNLLEFEEGWRSYNIEATPTLVHYENGEEVDRIVGAAPNEEYEAFLETYAAE